MSIDLAGCKIAILVESQYIPVEINAYRQRFAELGAEVHLIARLWGQPKLTFVSEVENTGQTPETLDVDIDLDRFLLPGVSPDRLNLDDYAAVLMSANYTSVRSRYYVPPHDMRSTPAVKLFADAMRNPRIIKGALCHGLWILTPRPELLAGRTVICHEVVAADIALTGANIVSSASGVVVDGDLVTGKTYKEAGALVDAIGDQILAVRAARNPPWSDPEPLFNLAGMKPQPRRILAMLSEWGYWGEQLVGPTEVFDAAGYQVEFVTPNGRRPNAIAASWDPEYVDPPLGRSVTSTEMAAKVLRWDDPTTPEGQRLEKPISLADWFPARPYRAAPQFVRLEEQYHRQLDAAAKEVGRYDALLIVGGSGPIVDLANNDRVHDLILSFLRAGKPIAAECYGVACLAFARDLNDRKSLLWGKRVTGRCKEYDLKHGMDYMRSRGECHPINFGPPPYPLEYILRDATGPDGAFIGNVGHPTSVIVDFPFITGRSIPDSYLTGQKLVEVLETGLRKFGWGPTEFAR